MDLQGDDAVLAGHLVFIDQFAHQVPVDLLDDAVSLGGDVVLVPVAVLDELAQFGRVGEAFDLVLAVLADHYLLAAAGQAAAIVLAVASARVVVGGIHVGLIAEDPPFLGAFPTADLHAGVGEARIGHAELDLQLEVARLAAPPDEKRVVGRGILLGRLAGDAAVLDPPEPRIAVPAVQRLAVEQRAEAVSVWGRRFGTCRRPWVHGARGQSHGNPQAPGRRRPCVHGARQADRLNSPSQNGIYFVAFAVHNGSPGSKW